MLTIIPFAEQLGHCRSHFCKHDERLFVYIYLAYRRMPVISNKPIRHICALMGIMLKKP
jgi:hypothetical protein